MTDYPIEPGFVSGSDTSEAAAASMDRSAGTLRAMIWKRAFEAGQSGVTCDEIEVHFDMRHQTASARIRELDLSGDLIKTERKRQTRSGRLALVYIANREQQSAA
ncbi:hypothetical protein [Bradyrhizobium sp. 150]|uniref:hypothetical protein n=1 Tax=Bradyrhizobium sp. 150 TaxID=2782625 RepID=UPI001FF701E1|nr:hypothetical protein [Bradyrhizobium sp. 150]MCK1671065.1 hypothetical protein [Bradyrhizobium sp. 150]